MIDYLREVVRAIEISTEIFGAKKEENIGKERRTELIKDLKSTAQTEQFVGNLEAGPTHLIKQSCYTTPAYAYGY